MEETEKSSEFSFGNSFNEIYIRALRYPCDHTLRASYLTYVSIVQKARLTDMKLIYEMLNRLKRMSFALVLVILHELWSFCKFSIFVGNFLMLRVFSGLG